MCLLQEFGDQEVLPVQEHPLLVSPICAFPVAFPMHVVVLVGSRVWSQFVVLSFSSPSFFLSFSSILSFGRVGS